VWSAATCRGLMLFADASRLRPQRRNFVRSTEKAAPHASWPQARRQRCTFLLSSILAAAFLLTDYISLRQIDVGSPYLAIYQSHHVDGSSAASAHAGLRYESPRPRNPRQHGDARQSGYQRGEAAAGPQVYVSADLLTSWPPVCPGQRSPADGGGGQVNPRIPQSPSTPQTRGLVHAPCKGAAPRYLFGRPGSLTGQQETLNARSEYSNSEDDGTAQHRINQYLIGQEIGRGSFGAVHLAVDQYGQEYVRIQPTRRTRSWGSAYRSCNTMRVAFKSVQ
jgi:hypothetical protein